MTCPIMSLKRKHDMSNKQGGGTDQVEEKGRKGKQIKPSKIKTLHEVKGQLSSFTHVLVTSPVGFFVELCTEREVVHILVSGSSQLSWAKHFTVGLSYLFRNLKKCGVVAETREFRIYKTVPETRWEVIKNCQAARCAPTSSAQSLVTGEITEVDSYLGIFCVENKIRVIVGTLMVEAFVPQLKIGQTVTLFNVHRIKESSGAELAVMCPRSFLNVGAALDSETTGTDLMVPSSVLRTAEELKWGYKNILWLQKTRETLNRNFTDEFLVSIGVSRDCVEAFRNTLLLRIVQLISMRKSHKPRQQSLIVAEVLSPQHACHGVKQDEISQHLVSIEQVLQNPSGGEDSVNDDFAWTHSVTNCIEEEKLLLAYLSVKPSILRFSFADATGTVICEVQNVTSESEHTRDMARLNGNIVLIWQHTLVRETFKFQEKGESKNQHIFYLHTHTRHLDIVACPNDGFNTTQPHSNLDPGNPVSTSMSLRPKGAKCRLTEFWSQVVRVHHKSSFMVRDCGKPPMSYLMVYLLGGMKKCDAKEDCTDVLVEKCAQQEQKVLFIVLRYQALCLCPLIVNNAFYELRLPLKCGGNFFSQLVDLSCVKSLRRFLPTVKGVILPGDVEIYHVHCSALTSVSMKHADCYSVGEALHSASLWKFTDIIGFVRHRFHHDPKYEREKFAVGTYGYGIPGSKIVVIVLSDTPLGDETGCPVTVYLSWWSTLQYPIGLVPGAKVRLTFVMKAQPPPNSDSMTPYFRASVLSAVDIIEIPSTRPLPSNISTQHRGILSQLVDQPPGSVAWSSVSMISLHSLTIRALCRFCNQGFVNGVCGFVGCSAQDEPEIVSSASFLVSELGTPTALVVVPSKRVEALLGASDKTWNSLRALAEQSGELDFKRALKEPLQNMPLPLRLFNSYCKTALMGRRMRIACRLLNDKKTKAYKNDLGMLPRLYCVDIQPVNFTKK